MRNPVWDKVTMERFPYRYEFEYQGPLTKCRILDTVTGLMGVGYAKLHDEDEYNQEVGMRISHSRALRRLETKEERWYIRNLVRPRNEA